MSVKVSGNWHISSIDSHSASNETESVEQFIELVRDTQNYGQIKVMATPHLTILKSSTYNGNLKIDHFCVALKVLVKLSIPYPSWHLKSQTWGPQFTSALITSLLWQDVFKYRLDQLKFSLVFENLSLKNHSLDP